MPNGVKEWQKGCDSLLDKLEGRGDVIRHRTLRLNKHEE